MIKIKIIVQLKLLHNVKAQFVLRTIIFLKLKKREMNKIMRTNVKTGVIDVMMLKKIP